MPHTDIHAHTPKDYNAHTDLGVHPHDGAPQTRQEAEKFIEAFFAKHKTITDANHHELAPLLNREALLGLIDSMLANPNDLEEIAAESYDNPLGFGKLVLLDGKKFNQPGFKLRVHTWYPNALNRENVEKPHEHHWDYASSVLAGSLENHKLIKESLTDDERKRVDAFVKEMDEFSQNGKMDAFTEVAKKDTVRLFEMMEIRAAAKADPQMVLVKSSIDTTKPNWNEDFRREYHDQLKKVKKLFNNKYSEEDFQFFGSVFKKYKTVDVIKDGQVVADDYVYDTTYRLTRPESGFAQHIGSNQLYYGSVRNPHKLAVEFGGFSTTMMLSAPRIEGWESGRFVPLTRNKEGESTKYRHYTADEVREQLEDLATNLRVEKYSEQFWFKYFTEVAPDPAVKTFSIDKTGLLNEELIPRMLEIKKSKPKKWEIMRKEWVSFVEEKLTEEHDKNAKDLSHAGIHGRDVRVAPVLDLMLDRQTRSLN